MTSNVKPVVKSISNRIIVSCGTNNLETDNAPEIISEKTMELEGVSSQPQIGQ